MVREYSGKKFELYGGSLILGKNGFDLDRKVGVKISNCQRFTHLKCRNIKHDIHSPTNYSPNLL